MRYVGRKRRHDLTVSAGRGVGTGVANDPTTTVKPSAGNAAGTGSAWNATVSVGSISASAGLASGTGTAWNPVVVAGEAAIAGIALGTGTSNQPGKTLKPNVGLASGTGAAYNATVATTSASAVYGSGVAGDSRANQRIGGALSAKLSYRFTAIASSAANTVRFQERGGSGYSLGTGGTMRCRIQTDSAGVPSGVTLATLTWVPGNPSGAWEVWTLHTFSSPATLSIGTTYHLVIDNTDADQVNNYISLNMLFTFNGAANPAFPATFQTLYAQPTSYVVQSGYLAIFDLAYASGTHDGQGYIGTLWANYGNITGASEMVREHFTVSGGSRTVTAAHIRLKRISGTGALVVRLETSAGSLIEAVNVAAASIAIGTVPDGSASSLAGDTWATATFLSSHVLTNGSSYNLRLSTDASTRYTAVPVQEGGSKGLLSKRFTDGDGQHTTDGTTWSNLYAFDSVDLQFYFDT